jgi:hypothetical protein
MTNMDRDTITIVSGLPRSGTSMMMRMLEAGGMQILTDNIRTADEDNPRGYYELERVKQIEHDSTWLEDARGKVVKMIAALLKHLPQDYSYRVIFIQRNVGEVLASQRQMLIRRGEPTDTISDDRLAALFHKHVQRVKAWLATQPNAQVIYVNYRDILSDAAGQAEQINQFLGGTLNVAKMASMVDPGLYRQRR